MLCEKCMWGIAVSMVASMSPVLTKIRLSLSRKHLIFVSSGGMGSSFLTRAIRKQVGVACVEKPFVNSFFFSDYPEAIRILYPNRPVVSDMEANATAQVCDSFYSMQEKYSNSPARFNFIPGISMRENMKNYLNFLRHNRIACVLRGSCCRRLLSEQKCKGAVFLIRHPLQAYISYTKPSRHKRDIDMLGGTENKEALHFWAWSWNSVANSYIDCLKKGLSPVLLRYEFIEIDLASNGSFYLQKIFRDFSGRQNVSYISNEAEERLKTLVAPSYYRIYDKWHLTSA
jgi:hypothetical protein